MAVGLPPPQTPQLAPLQQVRATVETSSVAFQSYTIHVGGALALSENEVKTALAAAPSLSDAVRNLTAAAYAKGFPAVQTLYALAGQELYVTINPGKLSAVHAAAPMDRYFDDLAGADPLTASMLERRRVLASVHADRAGVESTPKFIADGAGGTVLEAQRDGLAEPTALRLEYGNPGNRFVGRHFLDLSVETGDIWGDHFRLYWREALNGLNQQSVSPKTYHEPNLTYDRVTPWGIFGAALDYATYEFVFNQLSLRGELRQADVHYLLPLYADFDTRWTVQAKFDYIEKKTEQQANRARLQSEQYGSVELGSSYAQTAEFGTHHASAEGALSMRKGLGSGRAQTGPGELDYLLLRPTLLATYAWTRHLASSVQASGQLTRDTLPEQQEQVLGGIGNLSAWLPGVAVGDSGYVMRAQTEYTWYVYGFELKPRGFVEYGSTRLQHAGVISDVLFAQTIANSRQSLADAGVELGFKIAHLIDGAVSYASGFHDDGVDQTILDRSRADIYFRAAVKF